MSKNKIYITEEKLKNILKEELSIASEVIELSDFIINKICEYYEKSNYFFSFKTSYNTTVDVKIYSFNNNHEFSEWLDNDGFNKLYNGFSFEENILYITGIDIKGELNIEEIKNSVYHEIEHLIQSIKKGNPITSKNYDNIIKYINHSNPIISTVCAILYYTKKFELDANINGFYSDLKSQDLGKKNLVELINNSECGIILNYFKEWKNGVEKWTKTPYTNQARNFLYQMGIIKNLDLNDLKNNLINKINKSQAYLLKRIGKVYILAKKQYDKNITENNNLFFYKHDNTKNRLTKLKDDYIFKDLNKLF